MSNILYYSTTYTHPVELNSDNFKSSFSNIFFTKRDVRYLKMLSYLPTTSMRAVPEDFISLITSGKRESKICLASVSERSKYS